MASPLLLRYVNGGFRRARSEHAKSHRINMVQIRSTPMTTGLKEAFALHGCISGPVLFSKRPVTFYAHLSQRIFSSIQNIHSNGEEGQGRQQRSPARG